MVKLLKLIVLEKIVTDSKLCHGMVNFDGSKYYQDILSFFTEFFVNKKRKVYMKTLQYKAESLKKKEMDGLPDSALKNRYIEFKSIYFPRCSSSLIFFGNFTNKQNGIVLFPIEVNIGSKNNYYDKLNPIDNSFSLSCPTGVNGEFGAGKNRLNKILVSFWRKSKIPQFILSDMDNWVLQFSETYVVKFNGNKKNLKKKPQNMKKSDFLEILVLIKNLFIESFEEVDLKTSDILYFLPKNSTIKEMILDLFGYEKNNVFFFIGVFFLNKTTPERIYPNISDVYFSRNFYFRYFSKNNICFLSPKIIIENKLGFCQENINKACLKGLKNQEFVFDWFKERKKPRKYYLWSKFCSFFELIITYKTKKVERYYNDYSSKYHFYSNKKITETLSNKFNLNFLSNYDFKTNDATVQVNFLFLLLNYNYLQTSYLLGWENRKIDFFYNKNIQLQIANLPAKKKPEEYNQRLLKYLKLKNIFKVHDFTI
mmetsp:Transcript_33503/g.52131  ORF Transcript_33503/g.52131 Transcript_33503/m.52131 type:complete len:482 (-) Transcript_33503:5740-7185(-)